MFSPSEGPIGLRRSMAPRARWVMRSTPPERSGARPSTVVAVRRAGLLLAMAFFLGGDAAAGTEFEARRRATGVLGVSDTVVIAVTNPSSRVDVEIPRRLRIPRAEGFRRACVDHRWRWRRERTRGSLGGDEPTGDRLCGQLARPDLEVRLHLRSGLCLSLGTRDDDLPVAREHPGNCGCVQVLVDTTNGRSVRVAGHDRSGRAGDYDDPAARAPDALANGPPADGAAQGAAD